MIEITGNIKECHDQGFYFCTSSHVLTAAINTWNSVKS